MISRTNVRKTWLYAGASAFALTAAAPGLAFAQDVAEAAEEDLAVERMVVTGSRIARPELTANSPITTVGEFELTFTGTVNTEDLLNDLPQVIPGLTGQTNNPGDGTADVDLRDLGTNRTLVLLNGSRLVPNGTDQTVDLNTIPAALVERIELVTGGASATYGSDAVAGVVNFILKTDFEGFQLDSQWEITDEGDGEIFTTSLTIGGNFADGRGNAVFSGSYTNRQQVLQGDRDFSFFALQDEIDADGNPVLSPGGSSGSLGGTLFFADDCSGAGSGDGTPTFGCFFDPDGSPRPFDADPSDGESDLYNYAPVNFLQLPQDRWNFSAFSRFEINDHVEAYADGLFTQQRSGSQLAPTPAFLGFGVTPALVVDLNNPNLTAAQLAAIASADLDGTTPEAEVAFARRLEEVGPRVQVLNLNTFRVNGGFRGDLGFLGTGTAFDDWTWDASYLYGFATRNDILLGDVSVDLFQEAFDTGLLNPFGAGAISQEAADFIEINVQSTTERELQVANANIGGTIGFASPLAESEIALNFGGEWRSEAVDFFPSQALATGDVLGFNDAPAVQGNFQVREFFGETYVPLVEGLPFAELLGLEAKFRVSDYSTNVGTIVAFAFGGEYIPLEGYRIRANFQRAIRAPNIGELFSPQFNNFPGANDPCSNLSPEDAAGDLGALCVATGVPQSALGTNIQPNSQIQTLSGGNPDLQEERADTLTIGLIAEPSFIDNFVFTVDYFNIDIDDTIAAFGGGTPGILNNCYNVAQDADSPFCQAINRQPGGAISFVEAFSANIANLRTAGFDFSIEYGFEPDWEFGSFDFRFLGTYYLANEFRADPLSPNQDCVGRFGTTCGAGQSTFGHVTDLRWNYGPASVNLRWQYLGGRDFEGFDSAFDGDPTTEPVTTIGAENYLDLSVIYDVTDYLQVRAGIDNIIDNEPPILGDESQQANTFPAVYDVLGRTFRLGARLRF